MKGAAMIAIGLLALSFDASAQTEEQLKGRFRERMTAIRALKDAGTVGETTEGLIDAVDPKDLGEPQVRDLVTAENRDRTVLYTLIAKRTGESVQAVAQQAAIRYYREASPAHFLRLKDGRWVRKREVTEPTG